MRVRRAPTATEMATTPRSNRKVLVLPGDGIGPEIMREVMRVIEYFDRRDIARFDVAEGKVGGAAYDASGTPLTDETLGEAMSVDAVLFGSVGGPKWESLPFELQPERGLLRLRKEMDLFANLRPAVVFDALADASALKPELVAGLDLMIVRELTGGIYFGDPRGVETMPDGTKRGINTEVYTEAEIERVVRAGFELAQKRQRRLTEVDKANVMESGLLWREVARRVAPDYPDVALSFPMMLRYSFDMADEAQLVEDAVRRALAAGIRTADIAPHGAGRVATREMGDAILRGLDKAA